MVALNFFQLLRILKTTVPSAKKTVLRHAVRNGSLLCGEWNQMSESADWWLGTTEANTLSRHRFPFRALPPARLIGLCNSSCGDLSSSKPSSMQTLGQTWTGLCPGATFVLSGDAGLRHFHSRSCSVQRTGPSCDRDPWPATYNFVPSQSQTVHRPIFHIMQHASA